MFRRRRKDEDFAAEIQAHLELEADALRDEGRAKEDALALARREFGSSTAVQERFHEANRTRWLDHLAQDIRYALRTLGRSPAFTAAAILTLALGIGANTAIFSAIDEILFRPVSAPEPDRLAQIYSFNRKTAAYVSSSYPDYQDFAQRARSFRHLSAYVRLPLNVSMGSGTAERISVEAVTGNYFDMLGLPPFAGRSLRAEDDAAGAVPTAIIGEELWRRRFQADPEFIGKTIRIEGQAFTVVGIASRRLVGLNLNWVTPPEIWIPLHTIAVVLPRFQAIRVFDNRAVIWLVITGRLMPGVSTAAAQAELQTIAGTLAQSEPATNRDLTATVFPLSRSKFWPSYRATIANSLGAFAVAAGLVLLLACANLSNLLLERALGRRREFAVRLAIGAGRPRLIRQLLTESAVLSSLSCAAALPVAWILLKVLLRFPNALGLTLAVDFALDPRALLFSVAVSLVTAAVFGLAPALQATRPEILPSLKQSGNASSGRGRRWSGAWLIALQAACSTVLLIGGGLYGRSLLKAYSIDLGFQSDHLLTAGFSVSMSEAYTAERLRNDQQTLLRRLSTTPGVVSATVTSNPLLNPFHNKVQLAAGTSTVSVDRDYAGPDFLKTMGIALLAGRDFSTRDDRSAPKVAIVNQALASTLWPDGAAEGRAITLVEKGQSTPMTVVGIARNAKYGSLWEQPQPHLYFAAGQSDAPAGYLAVRTQTRPAALAPMVRRLWEETAPSVPLYDVQTGDERVDFFLAPQRAAVTILGAFGLLAICLTSVGLYSVVAYSVAQKQREIGIRLAIGARPRTVLAGILKASLLPAAAGLALGAVAAFVLMRIVTAAVRNVAAYDGPTYLVAALIIATVAFAAVMVPARRAMSVDPSVALRSD